MSVGKSEISNLLEADDIRSTIQILKQLGIRIYKRNTNWIVHGNGTNGFIQPKNVLDAITVGQAPEQLLEQSAQIPLLVSSKVISH